MKNTEQLVGVCTDDLNPDHWFPEFDNGRPSLRKQLALVESIKYAIEGCSVCPIKEKCLQEGMKLENLAHGIWGGLLAGERIESLNGNYDNDGIQTDVAKALSFYERMQPLLRE
jgi:hypothetical protein